MLAALSDLISQSEVWSAGVSTAHGKKRSAGDRSTKSVTK